MLRKKPIKVGRLTTRHTKYMTFQMAEVAVTRNIFAAILDRIARLDLATASGVRNAGLGPG